MKCDDQLDFAKARKISASYLNDPVAAWQEMFREVNNTLKEFDSAEIAAFKKK